VAIGAEGGLGDQPVPVKNLVLPPAEWADVIADFRPSPCQTLVMKNTPPQASCRPRTLALGGNADPGGHGGQSARAVQIPASLPGRKADLPAPDNTATSPSTRSTRRRTPGV
jgi:hypothetical protein